MREHREVSYEGSCGFWGQLESFAGWRMAHGRWNDTYAKNLLYFARHCAGLEPGAETLSQGALDSWCAVRDTEEPVSCAMRTMPARAFADWARGRDLTDAVPPAPPRVGPDDYVPHAFTDDELRRLFAAADSVVPYRGRKDYRIRKIQCVALFRLLYSSGIRTTEARRLRREDVDLDGGVLNIRHSKGPDQHYVALHPSMTEVLRAYDEAAERLQPGREHFFEAYRGGRLSRRWVEKNFKRLWKEAGNGDPDGVVPYQLRHEFATRNIMSWEGDAFDAHDRLLWLSRSMGHRRLKSTLHYFSLAPAISDKILEATGEEMDKIIPDVWDKGEGEGNE